jgi:TP901 family phage tail tape measure protein
MTDHSLGTIGLDIKLNDADALAKAKATSQKIAAIMQGSINASLGRGDPFAALDKHASKERLLKVKLESKTADQQLKLLTQSIEKERLLRIRLDAKSAEQEIKRLRSEQDKLERKDAYKLRIDTSSAIKAVKDASTGLEQYQKMMADVSARKIGANISIGNSIGKDTKELQRQLEVTKELERHRQALSKVAKMNIDYADAQKAKRELNELHAQSNKAIKIKFDTSGMNGFKDSLNNMLDGVARGAAASIGHRLVGGITNAVQGAVSGAGDIVGSSVKSFVDFGAAVQNVKVLSRGTDAEMKALSDEMLRLGVATSKTPTEAANAAGALAGLGFSAADATKQVEGIIKLSEATGMKDMAKVAEIAGTAFNIFGMQTKDAANMITTAVNNSAAKAQDFNQVFSKAGSIFKANGQSAESLAASFGILRGAGYQAQEAATALKTVMIRLAAPSAAGRDALEKIGVDVFDAKGNMKEFIPLVAEMKSKLGSFDNESKGVLLNNIFGTRGGPGFLALMDQSGAKLEELKAKLGKAGDGEGSATTSANDLLKGLPGALVLLEGSIKTIQIKLGTALAPAMEAITRTVIEIVNALITSNIFDNLLKGAESFAAYLNGNKEIVGQITEAIKSLATDGFAWINEQVKEFTAYLKENPKAIQETLNSTKELISDLASIVGFVVDMGKGFAQNTQSASDMGVILKGVADVVRLITGESETFGTSLGKALGWASDILNTISGMKLLSSIVQLANDLANSTSAVSFVTNSIVKTFQDMFGWIGKNNTASNILVSVWNLIKLIIQAVLSPLTNIYKLVDTAIQKTGFFKSQWDGMKNVFGDVANAINSLCGGALQGLIDKAQAFWETLKGIAGMGSGGNNASGGQMSSGIYEGMNPNVAAYLEAVRLGEGTGGDKGFTTMFTGAQFSDMSKHPEQLQSANGLTSDAAGAWQFLSTTWKPKADQLGLKDFSPKSQAKAAEQLLKDRGIYDKIVAGDIAGANEEGSREWASIAAPSTGQSRYGQGGVTHDQFMKEFTEAKTRLSGQATGGGIGSVASFGAGMSGGVGQLTGSNSGNLDASGQNGADMGVGPNNEMYSYHNGTVSDMGTAGNNGNYVVIKYLDDLGNTLEATYSHIASAVQVGQQVVGGQVLGKFDASGRTFGAHNSIDINTPGTNGALQRDKEGAAARRGADLLVTGKVQGVVNKALSPLANLGKPGSANIPIRTEESVDDAEKESLVKAEEQRKAVEEARKYQDSETKARREAKKKAREMGRKQELLAIEKQAVGITDPDLKKQLDFRKANLTTGAQSNDKIADLKDELTDLQTARKNKQADIKAGGDAAEKAKLLPDYSKAIAETKALIAQEEKYRDTLLGVSNAENNATLAADKLALARQQRDSNREKEYQDKKANAERTKAVLSASGMPTDKVSNKLEEIELTYKATEALQKLIDKREDAQANLTKYQDSLGKGKTDEQVTLKKGAIAETDKEIGALKKKYADDGIVLNLKIAADNRDEAIADRDRGLKFDKDDRLMQLRGELELQKQNNDQYAALTEIEIDRVEAMYRINAELNDQNDKLAEANDAVAALQAKGAPIDSEEMKSAEKTLDSVRQTLAQLTDKKNQQIKLFDIQNAKDAQEIAERMMTIRAEQQGVQFDATSKQRRSGIDKRRDKYGKYDSKAANDEKSLFGDERDQKLKEGKSGIDKDTADLAAKGYKRTAEEIRNLNAAMAEGVENEYLENLKKIPDVGREIATALGEGVTGAIKGLILEGKSLQESLSNLFSSLASSLLDLGIQGIFGGGGLFGGLFGGGGKKSGGGGGGLFSGVLGGGAVGIAYNGGIANYAGGRGSVIGMIEDAARRERSQSGGKNPVLTMVNDQEAIIPAKQTKELQRVLGRSISNYAMGNANGQAIANGVAGSSGGINVNVGGVSVTGGNPNVDQKALGDAINSAIVDRLLREQRPGGILA